MISYPDSNRKPTREELAAYADGELDIAGLANMEVWLRLHPTDRESIDADCKLARLFEAAVPAEPSETAWAEVTSRVRHRLDAERRRENPRVTTVRRAPAYAFSEAPIRRPAPRFALSPRMLRLTAAAAAIVVAILLYPRPRHAPVEREEAFTVAAPGDVRIISMDPADATAIVVGESPFQEPFIPASEGDVSVTKVHPEDELVRPIYLDRGSFPMILVPPPIENKKKPRIP
jgi:hypothetical protein